MPRTCSFLDDIPYRLLLALDTHCFYAIALYLLFSISIGTVRNVIEIFIPKFFEPGTETT